MIYRIVEAEDLFAGPDAGLSHRVFPGGTMILTSSFEVTVPMDIRFAHDPAGQQVSAQFFLSGEATIEMGDGSTGIWSQNGRSMVRSDTPGFRLRVEKGQVLRHVCVARYRHDLAGHFDRTGGAEFGALMAEDGPVNIAIPLPSGADTRAAAEQLYAASRETGVAGLRAEGLAIAFLADALDAHAAEGAAALSQDETLPWQRAAVRHIQEAIDADPLGALATEDILVRFRIGESMARRVFRAEYGVTPAVYLRQARIRWAEQALRNGATVKQVAHACGYAYIGNFTRAYQQETGELPSQTRQRALRA